MENYLTQEQKDKIIEYYVQKGRGQVFTAKQAKCSIPKLKQFLIENGYKIRNQSESTILSNQNRAKKKNKDYFKTESSNMAWLLGFLASDGNIKKNRNEICITLSKVDKEILYKIKDELSIETDIKDYISSNGYESSSLRWTCQEHKEDLKKYSIIPNKTFILQPPIELNSKYWIDYIRGFFDGDGSINFLNNNKSLRWQVCSASKDIIIFILNVLESYGIPKVNIQIDNRHHNPLYIIQYSTNATKKIYNILYTPNSLFLKRKKDKFEKCLSDINFHEPTIPCDKE